MTLLEAVVDRGELPEYPGAGAHDCRLVRHFQGGSLRNYMGIKRTAAQRPRATDSACWSPSAAMPATAARSAQSTSAGGCGVRREQRHAGLVRLPAAGQAEQVRDRSKPVRIFVMGKNEWRYEDVAARARQVHALFLHSAGKANSAAGDGALSTTRPRKMEPRTALSTIPPTPCPPSAALSAATATI
jgi:hypothetical protein